MIHYTVRTSPRSRRVRLSVTPREGVVIVVPRNFDLSRIPKIIVEKERWIKRAVQKVQNGSLLQSGPIQLPEKIILHSIDREYSIVVEYHTYRRNILTVNESTLTLSLNRDNNNAGFTLLKKWMKEKATEVLIPWLQRVSLRHGLPYHSAVIRNQRTRWGSCSAKKNINLNRLLLVLQPHLVEYLFIHELCHTIEMNHSKRYWELVEKHCPRYKLIDAELKSASRSIERWVY